MTEERDSMREANGLLAAGGIQTALALVAGALWIDGTVSIIVPAVFVGSGIVLAVLGWLERVDASKSDPEWLRKSKVSETHDEDPRDDMVDEDGNSMPDASVRPGESVSQADLRAIADEHDDVTVLGVDQSSDEVDKSGETSDE